MLKIALALSAYRGKHEACSGSGEAKATKCSHCVVSYAEYVSDCDCNSVALRFVTKKITH